MLIWQNLRGAPGEIAEFLTSSQGPQSALSLEVPIAPSSFGQQTTWAIDPVLGSDGNLGTPAAPLATMTEFNARMALQFVTVAQTLQLVGDVLDAPLMLQATRYKVGAGLAVSGTKTQTATGLVSTVTGLGPGGTVNPWLVVTTGIVWSAGMANQSIQLGTGHTAMLLEVVDANTIVLGPIGTLASTVTNTTPTVGTSITASTLSRAMPPVLFAMGQQLQSALQVTIQDVAFELGSASNGYAFEGGVGVLLFACEIKQVNALRSGSQLAMRCCGFSLTSNIALQPGQLLSTSGCVVRGAGGSLFNHQSGLTVHTNLCLTGARLSCADAQVQTGPTYIQKAATSAVLVNTNGYINGAGIIAGGTGALANLGFGVDCPSGKLGYFSSTKPTVTGPSGDSRIGGSTRTWGSVPFINTANGASIIQE